VFFKNYLVGLAAKFLWFGLLLGLFLIVCELVIKISKRNLYITNIVGFCYTLLSGGVFAGLCRVYYHSQFCWFGLVSMLAGIALVKCSIDFFFTKFAKMIYNVLTKLKKRKLKNEQLQTN
jgi:hypothetical protein